MKNIFRFLSRYLWAVALVVVLLAAQAFFDLSLPNYTSDLLNVGLQQGGIALDDVKVTDVYATVDEAKLGSGVVVRKGKKIFWKFILAK